MSATASQVPAPSPAVAPPPGNPRFALFDSMRAIAVLAVLTFHVCSITGAVDVAGFGDAVAILGSQGPILFFVISGFLLYRPYVAARAAGGREPPIGRYARRRALRIVPAYWLALTVLALFPGVVGAFSGDWWRYYFFLQLYSSDTLGGGIPVAWTLCVEASFYVLLPFWAMAVRRLGVELLPLALVALAGAIVQVAAAHNTISDVVATTILGQCTWLALGMALAVASVADEHRAHAPRAIRLAVQRPGLCWIGAAVAFAAITALLHPGGRLGIARAVATEQPIAKTIAAIALGVALQVLLLAPAIFGQGAGGLPRRVLALAPLAWLGLISYGMYLWHLTITELLGLRGDPAHFSAGGLNLAAKIPHGTTLILFVLSLGLTTAIAAVSYYAVELPFLRRKEG